MARKPVPNQLTLFDYRPEAKIKVVKEYKPIDSEAGFLIFYKDSEDVGHQSCPVDELEETRDYYLRMDKHTRIEVLSWDDYWFKFHNGGFQLSV